MRFSYLLPVLALPLTALADGAAILDSIVQIQNTTLCLNSSLTSWSGDIIGIVPILTSSTALLFELLNAKSIATASDNLTVIEAITVAQATQKLGVTVESTLATIVVKKPLFAKLLLQPVILLSLMQQKSGTDKFGAAVVLKVPAVLQGTAGLLLKPVDAAFDQAITIYEQF